MRERFRARFADSYRGLSDDEDVLRASVGGIAEVVQASLLDGRAYALPDFLRTLESFVRAVASERRGVAVA